MQSFLGSVLNFTFTSTMQISFLAHLTQEHREQGSQFMSFLFGYQLQIANRLLFSVILYYERKIIPSTVIRHF